MLAAHLFSGIPAKLSENLDDEVRDRELLYRDTDDLNVYFDDHAVRVARRSVQIGFHLEAHRQKRELLPLELSVLHSSNALAPTKQPTKPQKETGAIDSSPFIILADGFNIWSASYNVPVP